MTATQIPATPAGFDFPPKFAEWRQSQLIAALRIRHALESHDTVFLQAPPGVGKTPLALLLTKLLAKPREYEAKHWHGGSIITTITKLLQEQYLTDFPDMVKTAKGRDNFGCLIDDKATASSAACTHGWECPVQNLCPYIMQREEANAADIAVLNTAFYTYERAYTSKFSGHDLAVFDEAHELERTIMSFGQTFVSRRLFDRTGFIMPDSVEFYDGAPWDQFWEKNGELIYDQLDEKSEELEEAVKAASEFGHVNLSGDHGRLLGQVRDLKTLKSMMHAFARARKTPTEYVLVRLEEGNMRLDPIWGHSVSFHWPRKRVLMSGTILSPEFLAYCLGLDNAEDTGTYEYIETPSDFPAAQRPLIYIPTVKMSASVSDDDIDHMVATIDEIIGRRHLGQKGIIHTVSYRLRDQIVAKSKWKKLFVTHQAHDRLAVLEMFRKMSDGHVLVSPSMTTGVDLPEDQCRFQIIPKMPFPNRGDTVIRLRMEDSTPFRWNGRVVKLGQLAYAYATTAPLVQAYGRAMRSSKDWGYTYVLDSNFWQFQTESRWGPLFPEYFKEAVKYTNLEDL